MKLPIPEFDSNSKLGRILVGFNENEKGIRASDSRISWLGRSIKYEGADGKSHYLHKTSALKFIERNTEMSKKEVKKLSNHQIKRIISEISDDSYAQFNLGVSYLQGEGKPKNVDQAKHYFKLAADQGNPNAQLNLGLFYLSEDNNEDALVYLKLSADQGNKTACTYVGMLYSEGQKDMEKAVKYLKLAETGDAYNLLGILYEDGVGIKKDLKEAKKYYELGAAQNHPDAIHNLKSLGK